MDEWIEKLRKLGVSIDEDGFLNMYSINASVLSKGRQNARGWTVVGEGSYGLALRNEDKILKIQKDIKRKDMFDKERVKNFQREVKTQQMVYDCTKTTKSLTPKIFAYGKNWVLMKNAPGKTIDDWFKTNRNGVFQKAMRAYIKALQTIHKKCGIAHFDAHGKNAMYDDKTDTIKIIDWGKSVPVNRNNLTKEGMLKRYNEQLGKTNWQWMADLRSSPLRQYAIEILPYNARFRSLKPDDNIFDFMEAILRNTNNFPISPKTKAKMNAKKREDAWREVEQKAMEELLEEEKTKIKKEKDGKLTMADQREVAGRILKVFPKVIADGKVKGGLMTVSEIKSAVRAKLPSPMTQKNGNLRAKLPPPMTQKNGNKAIENLRATAIIFMANENIMKIQAKEGRILTMNEQMNIRRKYKTLIDEILKQSGKVMKMSELKTAVKARLPKSSSSGGFLI